MFKYISSELSYLEGGRELHFHSFNSSVRQSFIFQFMCFCNFVHTGYIVEVTTYHLGHGKFSFDLVLKWK